MAADRGQTGTYIVDGLLEGSLGGAADAQAKLSNWVQFARSSGYDFALEIEGESFNLLADNRAHPVPDGGGDISDPLRDLMQQLVDVLPSEVQGGLFSTVRSIEYGNSLETQTLYVLTPQGVVDAQQRTVDAVTTKAPEPLTTKQKLRAAITAVVVLLALIGISSLFIDWSDWFSSTWSKVGSFDAQAVERDAGPLAPYVTIEKLESKTTRAGNYFIVTLKRTAEFPKSVPEVDARLRAKAQEYTLLEWRLVLQALASGYVRMQVLADKNELQSTTSVFVGALREKESIEIRVPFRREKPPVAIRLTW